jgi:hypothetical protein
MPNLLVECEVQNGLFKTEYLVSLPGASFIVDRQDVRVAKAPLEGELVRGRVLAYLVEVRNDQAVIEMTGTPVNGGIRILVSRAITTAA